MKYCDYLGRPIILYYITNIGINDKNVLYVRINV